MKKFSNIIKIYSIYTRVSNYIDWINANTQSAITGTTGKIVKTTTNSKITTTTRLITTTTRLITTTTRLITTTKLACVDDISCSYLKNYCFIVSSVCRKTCGQC